MRIIKKALKPAVNFIRFLREIYLDGSRHYRSASGIHDLAKLESDIIRRYHVIEKGLSMPEFRPRFGQPIVRQLCDMIDQWEKLHSTACENNGQIEAAHATLRAYREKHISLGIDVSDILAGFQDLGSAPSQKAGGVRDYHPSAPEDLKTLNRMLHARVSVRHFDATRTPSRAAVERAVEAAIRSPSVCNRQTWRAHLYEGEGAQRVLGLQNGNRGFGHTVPAVFVVTSDLRYFGSLTERNQSWVDGGMFAMSLLLALHAEGLGAVALNWCVTHERDRELRGIGDIPDHERIIMLIGFGHPAQGCVVPVSQRRPVSTVLNLHA